MSTLKRERDGLVIRMSKIESFIIIDNEEEEGVAIQVKTVSEAEHFFDAPDKETAEKFIEKVNDGIDIYESV